MASVPMKLRYSYTKEQLIDIRDTYLPNEDLERFPVKKNAISTNKPSSRSLRKPRPLKMDDETIVHTTDEVSPVAAGDTPSTPLLQESRGLWRRSTGVSGSPAERGGRHSYVRHNSGSSGGDESTKTGTGKDGVDWTLGCGKWRHRSKSGSERGNKVFFSSGGRGRGLGDGNDNFTPGRGRGFARRPYQSFSTRGRSFKSLNGHHQIDQSDEFWNPDDWKDGYSAGSPSSHYNHQRYGPGDAFSPYQNTASWTPTGPKPEMEIIRGTPQPTLAEPPGIATSTASHSQRSLGEVSFMGNFPQHQHPQTQQHAPNDALEEMAAVDRPAPTLWYYLDSTGIAQGPYDDATMANWFTTGNFPISVEVRRQCDQIFYRLTDFITWMDRFPFVNSHKLPPILEPRMDLTPSIPVPSSPVGISMAVSPPSVLPAFPDAVTGPSIANQANSSVVELTSLSEATLNEVMRLQQDAKQLMERASALGADHAKLIGNFAALSVKNASTTAAVLTPPEHMTEPAVSQITALAAAVSIPTSPQAVEQQPVNIEPEAPASEQENQQAPSKKKQKKIVKTPIEQPVENARNLESQSPKPVVSTVVSTKTRILDMPHEVPPAAQMTGKKAIPSKNQTESIKSEIPLKPEETPQTVSVVPEPMTADPSWKNSKRQKKKGKSVSEAEEEKSIEQEVILSVVHDADWDTVTDSVFEPNPTYQQYEKAQQQQPEITSTKKPKKRKKGKPTAADIKQRAWEQEEERRRIQAAQRLAAAEAEAQRLAEEQRQLELAEAAEAKKVKLAALKELAVARQREEAKKKAAANEMANLKLPPTSQWGTQSSSSSGQTGPVPLADILAAQLQEQEYAKAQGSGCKGNATFAQKLGSNMVHQPTQLEDTNKAAKKVIHSVASPLNSDTVTNKKCQQPPQKAPANNIQSNTTRKVNQQSAPSKSQQVVKTPVSKAPPPSKLSATTSVSIWDLPSNPSALTGQPKKSKKKKPNASSQLLTGSMISLPTNTRIDLVHWCENQLSSFPRQNVDLPTLITLLCDIEEAEDIRLCLEASFGKCPLASKFSKAFVEKRALLMRLSA